jgi:hypothetical protein
VVPELRKKHRVHRARPQGLRVDRPRRRRLLALRRRRRSCAQPDGQRAASSARRSSRTRGAPAWRSPSRWGAGARDPHRALRRVGLRRAAAHLLPLGARRRARARPCSPPSTTSAPTTRWPSRSTTRAIVNEALVDVGRRAARAPRHQGRRARGRARACSTPRWRARATARPSRSRCSCSGAARIVVTSSRLRRAPRARSCPRRSSSGVPAVRPLPHDRGRAPRRPARCVRVLSAPSTAVHPPTRRTVHTGRPGHHPHRPDRSRSRAAPRTPALRHEGAVRGDRRPCGRALLAGLARRSLRARGHWLHRHRQDIRAPPRRESSLVEIDGALRAARRDAPQPRPRSRADAPRASSSIPVPCRRPEGQPSTSGHAPAHRPRVYAPGGGVAVKVRLDIPTTSRSARPGRACRAPPPRSARETALRVRQERVRRGAHAARRARGIGRMGNHWGLGMLANGGDCAGLRQRRRPTASPSSRRSPGTSGRWLRSLVERPAVPRPLRAAWSTSARPTTSAP